jgi:putative spermidine/putrescine transport system permease protein
VTRVIVVIAVVFALLPGIAVLLTSFTASRSLAFPPQGLSLRWYEALFSSPDFLSAIATSVTLAALSALLATALSIPASFALVRYRMHRADLLQGFLLSPMAVPHLVIGIGILQLYSVLGLRGDLMRLIFGHLLISIPFVLRILITSISNLDSDAEKAAASLGATRSTTILTVVLPQIRTAIVGALVAAFVISFDDVAVTVFLAQPGYMTLPVVLFGQAENAPVPTIHAASVILLIGSWLGVILIDRILGLERFLLPRRS